MLPLFRMIVSFHFCHSAVPKIKWQYSAEGGPAIDSSDNLYFGDSYGYVYKISYSGQQEKILFMRV